MDGIVNHETTPNHAYRYNGKELNEVSKTYEYGARYYDPSIGRFTGVDPISDQFAWVSPFNYAENSPIGNIDLWGLQKVDANKALFFIQTGQTWLKTKTFNKIYGNTTKFIGGTDGYGRSYLGRTLPVNKVRLSGPSGVLPVYKSATLTTINRMQGMGR